MFTGSGETVTPTKIKENTINIPRGDLTYPVACSTPLPISNTCTLDALNTHVGRDDILGISQIDSSDINDDSESSTDSERTVIVQCRSSTEGKITVTENLIIATSRHSSSNKSFDSPSKKRCAEQKKDTKKLKTSHENSSCSSKVVSTPQKNEASTSDNSQQTKATAGNVERDGSRGHKCETKKLKTKRRNISGSKRKSTADTAEANASNSSQLRKTTASDGKTGNPQELGKEVSTLTKKWLIKKEKRNCDESQRNSLNFGIPNKNGQKSVGVHGKPESVKKSPQSDKNAPKMSKENIPSCSKYIGSEGSPKASPKSAKSRGNPGKTRDVTGMSPNKSFKAKKEEKKMNKEPLLLITELFKTVFSSTHVNNLLETERQAIKMFFDMDFRYQYACLKLITWERKWYNAYKFCERIYLDMEDTDISDMVEFFDQEGIIDTGECIFSFLSPTVMKLFFLSIFTSQSRIILKF